MLVPTYWVKSWAYTRLQKGAFKNLEYAKACADKNAGYSVFDEQGGMVYKGK